MKTERVAYLCDGYGCSRECGKSMTPEEWSKYTCHHTLDESHAKNKIRRNRKFKEMENGSRYEV